MLLRTALFCLLCLPMVACGAADAAPITQTTDNSAAQPAPSPTPPAVVATVNGEPITGAAFRAALERRERELATVADQEALATTVLTEMINQVLVEQAAEQMGITISEAEMDSEISTLKTIVDNDEDAWQAWLGQNNYTEAQLREELRGQLIAGQVRDAVIGDAATSDTQQVQARHILVDTRAQAASIRAQVIAGESFVDLAAAHSKDVTTRSEGGDLGWFTREGLLEPIVAEVAFSQPEGTISEPVATRLGWHIIETLAFDNLPLPPEKQAEVAQVIFDEWLTTQTDSAIIEIYR